MARLVSVSQSLGGHLASEDPPADGMALYFQIHFKNAD